VVPAPPGLSLVTLVGASSIPVNSAAPVVDTTLITNNTGGQPTRLAGLSVSTDQLFSSCQVAPWSAAPVLVSPGSTVGVTTKAAAPGCPSLYTLSVSGSAPSGAVASAQTAWSQYLPKRH
jgi:hypothetical protein